MDHSKAGNVCEITNVLKRLNGTNLDLFNGHLLSQFGCKHKGETISLILRCTIDRLSDEAVMVLKEKAFELQRLQEEQEGQNDMNNASTTLRYSSKK